MRHPRECHRQGRQRLLLLVICLTLTDSRAYGRITALDVTWVSDDRRGVYTDNDIATATSESHVISPGGALRERTHTCFLLAKANNRRLFRSYVVFQLDRGGVLPLLKPPQSVRLALPVVIMILSRPCGGLGPACIADDNTTGDSDKNHRGPRNSWSPCFTLPFYCSFPHSATPRLQSPICCMKDHTVPVSNQTTLAGARPLLCPPTHTSTATRRASSTRQRRHSGSSLVGRPCSRRGPWWPSCPPGLGGVVISSSHSGC